MHTYDTRRSPLFLGALSCSHRSVEQIGDLRMNSAATHVPVVVHRDVRMAQVLRPIRADSPSSSINVAKTTCGSCAW